MSDVFKNRKINSPFGIFFQIPVFIVAIFGLYNLMEKIFYSLTKFDMLEKTTFVVFLPTPGRLSKYSLLFGTTPS